MKTKQYKITTILLISLFFLFIMSSLVFAEGETSTPTLTWTDFSSANYKVEKHGANSANLSISNITLNNDHTYFYVITSKNTAPIALEAITETNIANYKTLSNTEENTIVTDITSSVELNQDLYLWVIEKQLSGSNWAYNYAVEGKKLDRFAYPKYSDVFFATYLTYDGTQIIFNVPWDTSHSRKINVKIGKIDDISILNKIKNNEKDAFSKLLEYAKTSDTLYNNSLTATKISEEFYDCGYSDENEKAVSLTNLQDGAYYFLYAELDSENGKYYPVEGISLAQCDILENNNWYMFFLGDDNFKWNLAEDKQIPNSTKKDPTVAPNKIPFAGNTTFIVIIVISILLIFAIIGKIQSKRYKDIK